MNPSTSKFPFLGNQVALDFVNTLERNKLGAVELLQSFTDFVNWLAEAGLISSAKRNELMITWRDPRDTTEVIDKVRAFRKNLHSLATDLMEGVPVKQSTLDEINYIVGHNTGSFQIVRSKAGLSKELVYGFKAPVHFLVPMADAAMALLTETDHRLIRKCENPECVILFYDTSKNHTRRWCSMRYCGNRIKVAEFYKRRKH